MCGVVHAVRAELCLLFKGGNPGYSDGNFCASKYFAKFFAWVDSALDQNAGQGVLIHCFAGAHRGGTACVAYLMHKDQMRLSDALAAARQLAPLRLLSVNSNVPVHRTLTPTSSPILPLPLPPTALPPYRYPYPHLYPSELCAL